MLGQHAFCPQSGAPLSDEEHYVAGHPQRHSTADRVEDGAGLLTNGERRSTSIALLRHFRRSHQDQHAEDYDLYREAAVALRQLKAETDAWDIWVWCALREHLAREDYPTDWMHNHADLVCPHCHASLDWDSAPRGDLLPKCFADCTGDDRYLGGDIRERIREVFGATFEPVERGQLHEF